MSSLILFVRFMIITCVNFICSHQKFVFKFKELNLKLNQEVAKFEISVSEGAHYLSDHAVIYQPSFELGLEETQTYVQGGTGSGSSLDESAEE